MRPRPTTLIALTLGVSTIGVLSAADAADRAFRVTVGTSVSVADHQVTMTNVGNLTFGFPNGNFSCSSASVPSSSGSTVRSGPSVLDLITLKAFAVSSCSGPGGPITMTATGSWPLRGTSAATSGASDTVQVRLDDVSLRFQNAVGDFTMAGSIRGSFAEASQTLRLNEPGGSSGTFRVTYVNPSKPFLGKVREGDVVSFTGTFQTTTQGGSVNLAG